MSRRGEFLISVKAWSRVCPHSCPELPCHAEDNEEVENRFSGTIFQGLLSTGPSDMKVPGAFYATCFLLLRRFSQEGAGLNPSAFPLYSGK